jgi:hypothetical protein
MISHSERAIFMPNELELLRKATLLVAAIPDDLEDLRCHEVARAVGQVLDLPIQDGFYGFVQHTWLWVEKPSFEFKPKDLRWRVAPRILDVYCIGSLPIVRLLDSATSLPHVGLNYHIGAPRDDIDEIVVEHLVSIMKEVVL